MKEEKKEDREQVVRIYEAGYLIAPTVKEEDLESIVGGIRNTIEKVGGVFIAEGAPAMTRLSYVIEVREGSGTAEHDRAYFGWIKFEAETAVVGMLEASFKRSADIIRHLVFRTVREDTRAKIKALSLREVKRTDTIRTVPRKIEESVPVSEEDLDKALTDLTTE